MRLNTIGAVCHELGGLYRRCANGQIPWQDGRAAAAILKELREGLEALREESRRYQETGSVITIRPSKMTFNQLLEHVDPSELSQQELDALEALATSAAQRSPPNL